MRTVKDILETKGDDVKTIEKSATVFDAIQQMNIHHIGSLAVTDGGKLAGVITERDYARKVSLMGRSSGETPVADIMSDRVIVVSRSTSINECMALMTDRRVRHLPVLEEGELVGLISIGDVVKEIIDEQQFVIEQLESYIHT